MLYKPNSLYETYMLMTVTAYSLGHEDDFVTGSDMCQRPTYGKEGSQFIIFLF